MNVTIRLQQVGEAEDVRNVLSNCHLPFEDLLESNVILFVAEYDQKIIATIGIEKYASVGLLRSFAVVTEYRDKGLGRKLLTHLLDFCETSEIIDLYLLTTTADKYFEKYWFRAIDRNAVPELIKQTKEFNSICPLSAVVMQRQLNLQA